MFCKLGLGLGNGGDSFSVAKKSCAGAGCIDTASDHSVGVEPATYTVQSEYAAMEAINLRYD